MARTRTAATRPLPDSRNRATRTPAAAPRPDRDLGATHAVATGLALAAMILLYAVVVLRTAWLSDDAYITFRTIDNFVHGYGLRWNVAERVQTFTAPLWMMLLTAVYVWTREIYLTALCVSIVIATGAVALLGWYARRRNADLSLIVAAMGILVFSRAFVDYSTSGLENPLSHLLLVIYFAIFFADGPARGRRIYCITAIAGLLALDRMDTVLLILPSLACDIWHSRRDGMALPLLVGFAPLVLWEAFSVTYYGIPFPNTAYAKLRTGIPHVEAWAHGFAYFRNSWARDPITLAAIGAGTVVALSWRSWKRTAAVAGILLYLVYICEIGGDFMSGRFFAAPLLVATMLIFDVGAHLQAYRVHWAFPAVVVLIGCIGATPTIFSARNYGRARGALLDENGVADERGYYYPMTGLLIDVPIAQRPASEAAVEGRKARLHDDPLMVNGMVGFAGFFAGPETYVADYHGLGDPLLSRLPMAKSDPLYTDFCTRLNGHACATPWRVGHYLRNVPAGYLDSLLANSDQIADPGLHKFYEAIRLITRGPIWSSQRWADIAKMNFGSYDALIGPMEPVDYQPTRFAETYERHPDVRSVSLLGGAARNYIEGGQNDQAIACYQKLVAIDPTVHEAWNNLGQLLLMRGDDAAGEAALVEAVKLRPGRPEPYAALADRMEKSGRRSEAVSLFRRLAGAGDTMAEESLRRMNATAQ